MKKKLFASVLCIAMGVILLAGCGNSNTGNAKAEETTVTLLQQKLKQRYGRADRRVQ